MSSVDIIGVGLVTPGGTGLDLTWASLMHGRVASSRVAVLPSMDWNLPDGFRAGLVDHDTLKDLALWAIEDPVLRPEAVFVGSSSDSYRAREDGANKPPRLSRRLTEELDIPYEKGFQFSNACAASSTAIAAAVDFVRAGKYGVVLAGGADELTLSSVAGFMSCRLYADKCLPFSDGQRGLFLSDGAAFVLLASPASHQLPVLGRIAGSGLVSGAADAVGMSAAGVERAIRRALEDAKQTPANIGVIIAHGTGTKANDAAEIAAIRSVWHRNLPVITSYKQWLGHPQGASGAIGVALAVEILRRQLVFPATSEPLADYALDSRVAKLTTSPTAEADWRSVMVLSHGTWDIYTALVVSK